MQAVNERVRKNMAKLRVDLYGGYSGEPKPDPDHCYSWKQEDYETPQDFVDRINGYIRDMVEQLDKDSDDAD